MNWNYRISMSYTKRSLGTQCHTSRSSSRQVAAPFKSSPPASWTISSSMSRPSRSSLTSMVTCEQISYTWSHQAPMGNPRLEWLLARVAIVPNMSLDLILACSCIKIAKMQIARMMTLMPLSHNPIQMLISTSMVIVYQTYSWISKGHKQIQMANSILSTILIFMCRKLIPPRKSRNIAWSTQISISPWTIR